MMHIRRRRNHAGSAALIFAGALAAGILSTGCGQDPVRQTVRDFDRIAAGTLDLYRRVHPLRWTRLGLAGADSLLFTFSPAELERTSAAIDSLLASLSALNPMHLDERRIDDSALMLNWMMGLRFALGPSGEYNRNPLLYCWLIEETLFALPARPFDPSPMEAEDYALRLGRLPALVETAARRLDRPGIPYLETSLRRLEDIEQRISALARLVERRYGRPIDELDAAARALAGFREALAALRDAQPRERMIMGLEDLALVLKHAERIDLDLSDLITEAENTLRRQTRRQEASLGVRQPQPAPRPPGRPAAQADSLLAEIEAALDKRGFRAGKRHAPKVAAHDPLYCPLRIPVNPYLTVPATRLGAVYMAFGPQGLSDCDPVVVVTPNAPDDEDLLFYNLLLASTPFATPAREACRQQLPLRLALASETFHFGWRGLMLQELLPLWPARRPALARIDDRERFGALARMVATLSLHAGIFTMEAASVFLQETAVVPEELIADEVLKASISPSAAFEGIAALLLERMIKQAGMAGAERDRRETVKRLLQEGNLAPLGLLMRRLPA